MKLSGSTDEDDVLVATRQMRYRALEVAVTAVVLAGTIAAVIAVGCTLYSGRDLKYSFDTWKSFEPQRASVRAQLLTGAGAMAALLAIPALSPVRDNGESSIGRAQKVLIQQIVLGTTGFLATSSILLIPTASLMSGNVRMWPGADALMCIFVATFSCFLNAVVQVPEEARRNYLLDIQKRRENLKEAYKQIRGETLNFGSGFSTLRALAPWKIIVPCILFCLVPPVLIASRGLLAWTWLPSLFIFETIVCIASAYFRIIQTSLRAETGFGNSLAPLIGQIVVVFYGIIAAWSPTMIHPSHVDKIDVAVLPCSLILAGYANFATRDNSHSSYLLACQICRRRRAVQLDYVKQLSLINELRSNPPFVAPYGDDAQSKQES